LVWKPSGLAPIMSVMPHSAEGVQPVSVGALYLYPTMQEEWHDRLRMIREAREFLYLSTYFIQHDEYGLAMLDELADACARGVAVYLLVDGFGQMLGNRLMSRVQIRELERLRLQLAARGAVVHIFRPQRLLQRMLYSGVHIKIQLSDTGEALFSSGNISSTTYARWHEMSLRLRGQVVVHMLQEFERMGVAVPLAHVHMLEAVCASAAPATATKVDYISFYPSADTHPLNPLRQHATNKLTEALVQAIGQAQESLYISSFYFKPVPVLVQAVLAAAKRGVRVSLFHSGSEALGNTIVPWLPCYLLYPQLLRAGVSVYERNNGEHSKMLLIDDKEAWFGSYNFEQPADYGLAEAMLRSHDEPLVSAVRSRFADFQQGSAFQLVTAQKLAVLPVSTRIKSCLAKPFARWL
jgi:cardiolipin synthase A/B